MLSEIVFEPRAGAPRFDVELLRRKLFEWPECIQDPHEAETVMVVHGEAGREYYLRKREADSRSSRACGIVTIEPHMVSITQDWADDEERAVMRDFASWLVTTYDPKIGSSVVGDDWTDRCAGNVDILFERQPSV